jgi:hypothetical protein
MKRKMPTIKDLREFYGLTIVIVPTVVMAIISQYLEGFMVRAICQVLLLFMQAVIVRGMLENKYSE